MNFRSILSKSSLRSSSTSGKSTIQSEEVSKLHSEIELLKQTVESLKVSLESRDAAIGTLAREKEKLYVELKSAQRTNRNLHQQLVDERDIHSKEKEYLIEEIKRVPKNDNNGFNGKLVMSLDNEQSTHSRNGEEIKAKDEVICKICAKYLKIKSSKQMLQKKLEKLQYRSQKTCENIILLLQENRQTLDTLLNKLIKSSTTIPNSKKYLKLLKINANLHYENTQLKICLSQIDFPIEEEETSDKECHQDESVPRKCSKSESKLKAPNLQTCRRRCSLHSRPLNVHGDEIVKSFKNLHGNLSPSFRRKLCLSHSDPCLVRNKIR